MCDSGLVIRICWFKVIFVYFLFLGAMERKFSVESNALYRSLKVRALDFFIFHHSKSNTKNALLLLIQIIHASLSSLDYIFLPVKSRECVKCQRVVIFYGYWVRQKGTRVLVCCIFIVAIRLSNYLIIFFCALHWVKVSLDVTWSYYHYLFCCSF